MALLNEADKIYVGGALATKVYYGATLVWSATGPAATYSAMQFSAIFGALQLVSQR